LKRVFSSHDRLAVHHARNLCAAEGIACEVRNDLLASAMGELPPAECLAELWVLDARDAERALRVLRGSRPAGPDWTCARCGEVLGAQFAQCWKCGADRGG